MADPPPSNVGIPQHRINHLTNLADDWDSYGGKAPTEQALAVARSLNTVPTSDGGLQFEWHVNGWDIEVEFGPDGRPDFWAHHRGSGEMVAGVAAGPQATPQVLWEGETVDPEIDGWPEGISSPTTDELLMLEVPPGTRVRVVAAPTGDPATNRDETDSNLTDSGPRCGYG